MFRSDRISRPRRSFKRRVVTAELFEVTAVGKDITHWLEHVGTVTCEIVFLSSYVSHSLCAASISIVLCNWEFFNDRNLVLLNSAACSDAGAKTFLELVVFSSGSPALLPPPLSTLGFSLFLLVLSSSLCSFFESITERNMCFCFLFAYVLHVGSKKDRVLSNPARTRCMLALFFLFLFLFLAEQHARTHTHTHTLHSTPLHNT